MPRFELHHLGSPSTLHRNPATSRIETLDADPPWVRTVILSHRPDENIVRISIAMNAASRTMTRTFSEGPFFAKTFVAEASAALMNASYAMTSPDEQLPPSPLESDPTELLLSRMAEGDKDAYLVYADGLLDRGDPRGELITLLTKDPREPGVAKAVLAWMDRHPASELVPPEISARLSVMKPEWRLGFLSSIRVGWDPKVDLQAGRSFSSAALLRILFEHPVAKLLRSVTIGLPTPEPEPTTFNYARPMMGLAMYGPESLRSITINDEDVVHTNMGDPTFFWLAFPHLEELSITGAETLGALFPNKLKRLVLCRSGSAMAQVANSRSLSELEELSFTQMYLGAARDFAPFVDLKRFPKLKRLAFKSGGAFADDVCAMVVRSSMASQLESLSLPNGAMTDEAAQLLIQSRGQFESLKELDISANQLSSNVCRRMVLAFPNADVRWGMQSGTIDWDEEAAYEEGYEGEDENLDDDDE